LLDRLSRNGTNEIPQLVFSRQLLTPVDNVAVNFQHWREGDVSQQSREVCNMNNISVDPLFVSHLPGKLIKPLAERASRPNHFDCHFTGNVTLRYVHIFVS